MAPDAKGSFVTQVQMMIQQYLRALDTLIGWVFVLTRVSFQNQCLLFVLAGICLRQGRCCYSPLKMASSYWVPGNEPGCMEPCTQMGLNLTLLSVFGAQGTTPTIFCIMEPWRWSGLYNFNVLSRPRGQVFLSVCKDYNSHLRLLTAGHCGAPHSKPPSSEVLGYQI